MSRLTDLAGDHQQQLDQTAMAASSKVVRLWRNADPADLERSWTYRAPEIVATLTAAQVSAARDASTYGNRAASMVGAKSKPVQAAAVSFGGVTKEGRQVGPELYGGVTYTKSLIKSGMGVGQAFQAGTAVMSILAGNVVRDAGRAAGGTVAVGRGMRYYVRVVQPGACSRCAILAGVKGYRVDFERHPGCRCTSIWIGDYEDVPEGFFRHPVDYFDSLSEAEQDRVFTKSGAWAIRNGADPAKVVNARRGAYKTSIKHGPLKYGPSRLKPITIGVRPDGSPLQVYATVEGTTARGGFGRANALDVKRAGDRYRRTSTVRLMPESIFRMSESASPERVRELLVRYGYII